MRHSFAVIASTIILLISIKAWADDRALCFDQDARSAEALTACDRLLKTAKQSRDVGGILLWRGVHKSNAKDYKGAIPDLTKSISLIPTKPEPYYYRGTSLYFLGNLAGAVEDLSKVFTLDPKYEDGREHLVAALVQLERFDEAIARANEWLTLKPNNAKAVALIGAAWYGKKDFDRALRYFDQAISLSPNDAILFNNRASAFREKGELDKALEDFERAIELDPTKSGTFNNRGLVWRARDDVDRAIEDFNRAIALDANNPDPLTNRGLTYEAKGEIDKAIDDFRSAIEKPVRSLFSKRYKATSKARLEILRSASSASKALTDRRSKLDQGGRRIALVIGNGKYLHAGNLSNPPNDAHLIADALQAAGFEVSAGFDLDRPVMRRKIEEFLAAATGAKIAVVFYAGHGMQVDGKNYLVPIDFQAHEGINPSNEMLDVDFILSGLDDQIRTNVIILDACRDNPLAQQPGKQSASRSVSIRAGLASPSDLGSGATLGAGTLIAFATAPGQVALDGEGANSPFSTALGRHIATPGLEVQQMLTRVRAEVVAATKSKQVPWSNSSLLGEVYLVKQ